LTNVGNGLNPSKVKETAREVSFCGHAILGKDLFIVPNALDDTRFADNPLVTDAPYIRFYAGCPLVASNGAKLGTLCLIDQEPRMLSKEDQKLLQELAKLAQQELALMQTSTIDEVTHLSNLSGFQMLATPALGLAESLEMKVTLLLLRLKHPSNSNHLKTTDSTEIEDAENHPYKVFARQLLTHFQIADIISRVSQNCFATLLTHAEPPAIEAALTSLKNEALSQGLSFETQQKVLTSLSEPIQDTIQQMIDHFQ
jgi:GGDEF domain-containing protein